MRTLLLSAVTLGGVLAACAIPASAGPVAPLPAGFHTDAAPAVQTVDYYWHHRHYHHRDWDRRHHHWRYY